jgi:hypothetical protein
LEAESAKTARLTDSSQAAATARTEAQEEAAAARKQVRTTLGARRCSRAGLCIRDDVAVPRHGLCWRRCARDSLLCERVTTVCASSTLPHTVLSLIQSILIVRPSQLKSLQAELRQAKTDGVRAQGEVVRLQQQLTEDTARLNRQLAAAQADADKRASVGAGSGTATGAASSGGDRAKKSAAKKDADGAASGTAASSLGRTVAVHAITAVIAAVLTAVLLK